MLVFAIMDNFGRNIFLTLLAILIILILTSGFISRLIKLPKITVSKILIVLLKILLLIVFYIIGFYLLIGRYK